MTTDTEALQLMLSTRTGERRDGRTLIWEALESADLKPLANALQKAADDGDTAHVGRLFANIVFDYARSCPQHENLMAGEGSLLPTVGDMFAHLRQPEAEPDQRARDAGIGA